MPNALPSLVLRTPPGWTARRIELAVGAAASLELQLVAAEPGETAAALGRRLEGTDALDVRRIGDREVAVLVGASEARLFSTDGKLAWVGVLRHDDPALVESAAGLMAGAAREIVAPWLTADFSEEELTGVAELAGLRGVPGVAAQPLRWASASARRCGALSPPAGPCGASTTDASGSRRATGRCSRSASRRTPCSRPNTKRMAIAGGLWCPGGTRPS